MTSSWSHFALAGVSPAPALLELLELGPSLRNDPLLAQELARITLGDLRAQFPAGQPDVRVAECASGLKLKIDVSDSFGATAYVGFLQENDDFAALMSLIEEGGTVIDVGANFGLYAAHAALRVGPSGAVHAYEPAREALELLRANAETNAIPQLHVHPFAVGAARKQGKFFVADDLAFSGLRDTGRSAKRRVDKVQIVKLDDEAHFAAPVAVDVVKIDVEGGEAEVLMGAEALLARSPRAIVQFEYSHKNLTPERSEALGAVVARIRAQGFRLYRRGENGAAERLDRVPAFIANFSANLFLAREGEAEGRLNRALYQRRLVPTIKTGSVISLMRRIAEQNKDLQASLALNATIGKIAASMGVTADPSAPAEALQVMQQSWFALRAERDRAQSGATHHQKRGEALEGATAQLTDKVKRVEAALTAAAEQGARKDEFAARLGDKVEGLKVAAASLTEAIVMKDALIADLNAAIAAASEENRSKAELVSHLAEKVEGLKVATTSLTQATAAKATLIAQLEAALEAASAANKQKDNVVALLGDKIEGLKAARESLTESVAAKQTLIAQLEAGLEAASAASKDKDDVVGRLGDKIEGLKTATASLTEAIKMREMSVAQLQAKLNDRDAALEAAKEQLAAVKRRFKYTPWLLPRKSS